MRTRAIPLGQYLQQQYTCVVGVCMFVCICVYYSFNTLYVEAVEDVPSWVVMAMRYLSKCK